MKEKRTESTSLYSSYSQLSLNESLNKLDTSHNGLSEKEVEKRRKIYGYNEPAKDKRHSLVVQFLLKFLNPLILILMIILGFSLFFGEKMSVVFIGLMILISVVLTFIQEYNSQRAIEKLRELVRTKVIVYRNGKEEEKNIKELVPGDIINLYVGDVIPADVRILSSNNLFVNQSSLTGESIPVQKYSDALKSKTTSINSLNNIAFMGSNIVSGSGKGLVISTGLSTQFGEISKTLAKDKVETNFDIGIKKFTYLMIKFIIILVIAIFIINFLFKKGSFKEILLFSLAVAVGLTPETLPMLVTINLARGAKTLSKKKVIIKHLDSIQNFGAMDVLCTDKTGTLTENKIVLEKYCDLNGKENEQTLKYTYLNSYFQTGVKNIIEKAVLDKKKIQIDSYSRVGEIPFDYSRKIISVVVAEKERKQCLILSKGAPEEIFKRCTQYELSGKIKKIDKSVSAKFMKEYESLSNQGFIVLAVAYKKTERKSAYSVKDEDSLILLGYLAFLDPPKKSTKKVILSLKNLGIEMKVLTGDNEIITRKVCKEVGFEIKGLLTGEQIDAYTDDELKEIVEKTNIFTRLNPLQKEKIINALRRNNHTVGYLGDGINDAPALKAADVGISVNNAAVIARESADIILLEKSLMVLSEGVVEGRKTFGNIIKYIKMGSSSNFGNMISLTGATIFLPFLPMLPIQILVNNFFYDLSQIPIPLDEVDKEYTEKPRSWNIGFIQKFMLIVGPVSSLFDFITFGVMYFVFAATTPSTSAIFQTGWFIESLCSQTLVIYIIRTNKIPFIQSRPNKTLVITTLSILALAIGITLVSFGKYLGFTALPLLYFIILFFMMLAYLFLVQVVKSWVVKKYGYQ